MLNDETKRQLEDLQRYADETNAVAEELMKNDPKMKHLTAIIMAGDKLSADRSDQMLEDGKTYSEAQVFVGSYYRLDWSLRAMQRGHTTMDNLLDELPELWRGSDPDDTDPRFLRLWKEAWQRNGRKYIRDGKPLPRTKVLTIYRGQDEGATFGIAWTLDPKIAQKFARGAGSRENNRDGIVYRVEIPRTKVMAYLTERGESEVIVDPTLFG